MKDYPYFKNLETTDADRLDRVVTAMQKLSQSGQFDAEIMWGLVEKLPADIRVNVYLNAEHSEYRYIWMRYKLKSAVAFSRWSLESLREFMDHIGYGTDGSDCIDYMECNYGIVRCDHCGDWEHEAHTTSDYCGNNYSICRECISTSYRYSDYYDGYINVNDAVWGLDPEGDRVLIDSDDDNFSFNDDLDTYVHYEYEPNETVIGKYHSSKERQYPQDSDWTRMKRRYLGVELEVEVVSGRDREEKAQELHDKINEGEIGKQVFFENDGSISHGFEIISQPMGLDRHKDLWAWLKDKNAVRYLRSHNTTSCGLHVHVSRAGMTKLQIAKMVAFVNSPDNESLIRAVARRYAEGYCRIKVKKMGQSTYSDDRYEALNITPRRTVEFRIFKGSIKYESVMAAIQFSNAVVEFCAQAKTSIRDLTSEKFMDFISTELIEDTDILRPYLMARLELA